MPRSLLAFPMAPLAFVACVDVSYPTEIVGPSLGRNPGPICSPEVVAEFLPEELRIHLIDVGQGDAIWVQTPYFDEQFLESKNILVDAGPSGFVSGTSPGGAVVVAYMIEHGMLPGDVLDALVITHAHEDHYGGGSTVASTFEIDRYVDSGYSADSSGFLTVRGAAQDDVQRLGGDFDTPAIGALVNDLYGETDLFGEFVDARVIAASATSEGGDEGTAINNTSVAFALSYVGNQVLLMADLEDAIEQRLIAAHDQGLISLTSRVLKVAHHGSRNSTSQAFLQRVFPPPNAPSDQDWAVISSGVRSFSGTTLPTEETRTNLANHLLPRHVLSTENDDQDKASGTEHDDDHILIRLLADGRVEACYTL